VGANGFVFKKACESRFVLLTLVSRIRSLGVCGGCVWCSGVGWCEGGAVVLGVGGGVLVVCLHYCGVVLVGC